MTIRTAVLTLAMVLIWPLCANAAESVPTRGMTMAQVKDRFGPPQRVRAPVGQPPITRWYYPGFTVYFERNLTLDTVINQPHAGNAASTADDNASVIARDADKPASKATAPTHTATQPSIQRRPTMTEDPDHGGQPDPHGGNPAAPQTPAPTHDAPKPADPPPASGGDEPADHSNHAPASSAIRAERQQQEANSQFRFNPQSGRIEIVNDAKAASANAGDGKTKDSASGAAGSAATDGHSTQPATNVSTETQGTDTVAQPPSAPATDSGKPPK